MFYVEINQSGKAVNVTTEYPKRFERSCYEHRNDWKTMERVEQIARELTEALGVRYVAVDNGRNVSPRYDVILAPRIGDSVSKGFNGDYYPEGEIVKISASLRRIETSTGAIFFRRRQSATWLESKTWALVDGHHNERNPSF